MCWWSWLCSWLAIVRRRIAPASISRSCQGGFGAIFIQPYYVFQMNLGASQPRQVDGRRLDRQRHGEIDGSSRCKRPRRLPVEVVSQQSAARSRREDNAGTLTACARGGIRARCVWGSSFPLPVVSVLLLCEVTTRRMLRGTEAS